MRTAFSLPKILGLRAISLSNTSLSQPLTFLRTWANSVSMRIAQLGQQLEQVQESIQDTSAEILDDSLSLVTSTQTDPSSRQPGDLVPATNIQEIQKQLAANTNDSPSRRQSNFLSSTNPFNMIQMELLIPTPAKESSETRNINENDKFETCTVCKKICRDVRNLQEHLLTNHCGQSPPSPKDPRSNATAT